MTPTRLRLVDGAIEGAERGKALTQRLLAFARQQDLRPATVDAPKLLRGTIEMLARSIGPSVEIRSEIAPDLWPVRVDANQLELALLNLGLNARDAMPDGGTITLSARNETIGAGTGEPLVPGDYVCLTVADTGVGMDQATLARCHRPVLHHQRRRQGHRPRPVDGRRHGGPVGRLAAAVELPGRRHDGRAAAAVRRGSVGDPRRGRRPNASLDPLPDPAGRRRCAGLQHHREHAGRSRPSGERGPVGQEGARDPAVPGPRSIWC